MFLLRYIIKGDVANFPVVWKEHFSLSYLIYWQCSVIFHTEWWSTTTTTTTCCINTVYVFTYWQDKRGNITINTPCSWLWCHVHSLKQFILNKMLTDVWLSLCQSDSLKYEIYIQNESVLKYSESWGNVWSESHRAHTPQSIFIHNYYMYIYIITMYLYRIIAYGVQCECEATGGQRGLLSLFLFLSSFVLSCNLCFT